MSSTFLQKISTAAPVSSFLIGRTADLELPDDRREGFLLQRGLHREMLEEVFPSPESSSRIPFIGAEQVHGTKVALVTPPFIDTQYISGVDGLMTAHAGVILGIVIADCAPVWIVEANGKAGALVHSGKRGTEAGIVPQTIALFETEYQIPAADLMVTIGPCIRPPCYEVDFAETIREQALAAGVKSIQDDKICTACHLDRYYSYRREEGKTGRMLATLMLHREIK